MDQNCGAFAEWQIKGETVMNISERGLDLIKHHEGCCMEAYQDAVGIWTIGYGHTRGVLAGDTCMQEHANTWLVEDVQVAERCIDAVVTVPLSQNEFDALCSFTFNLGCQALRKSTLLRKLNEGDRIGALEEFHRWNLAGGKMLAGLTARREDERALFEGTA
jgi:lysozyme